MKVSMYLSHDLEISVDIQSKILMKEKGDVGQTREGILDLFKTQDATTRNKEIEDEEIVKTYDALSGLYSATFRPVKSVPLIVFQSDQQVKSIKPRQKSSGEPHAFHEFVVTRNFSTNRQQEACSFDNEKIYIIKGDPKLIYPRYFLRIYRYILSHELIHAQVIPEIVAGKEMPSITAEEIESDWKIHYVGGFKAVSMDPERNISYEHTKPLEEYTVQYLSMALLDLFKNKSDPVLRAMELTGLGINGVVIRAAGILNKFFLSAGITPDQIEKYHGDSDIRGLLRLLDQVKHGSSRFLLDSGTDENPKTSLEKLRLLTS